MQELSKREKIEQMANQWGYKIAFKDTLEKDDLIFKIPWSDGTYTIVFVIFDCNTLPLFFNLHPCKKIRF